MISLISVSLFSAALASTPSADFATAGAQSAAWAGLGMSVAGSTMLVAGGFGFYKGPFDAINRQQGQRDKLAREPGTAIASGVVVGGGLGLSAIGRPILSFGSTLAATRHRAAGGAVQPTLGWISVGTWAAGVGAYFAARGSDTDTMDWTWAAMRGASFGTGLAQLLQTHAAMQGNSATRINRPAPPVRLVVGPSGGAIVGTF